jgi:hypothetical protein
MDANRLRLDFLAFALAVSGLCVAMLGFFATRNAAALLMAGLCLAGLIAGRLAGISGLALLGVAVGLLACLWLVWVDAPVGPRKASAGAHAVGGTLIAWAIAITLRARGVRSWALVTMLVLLALTVAWEVAELIADTAIGTALVPSATDSAFDIAFGCFGGLVGIVSAALLAPRRPEG